MDKKYLYIGGGLLVVLVLFAAMRGPSTASAQAPAPAPDTSAQDTAEIQGKYGLLTTLANAAGTLDLVNAQNSGANAHDQASIGAITAGYSGQSMLTTANYAGQGYVTAITGAIQKALAGIVAKNNVDLAMINKDTSLGLASIDSQTQLGLGAQDVQKVGITTKGQVDIAGINATTQQQQNSFDYLAHINDNQTAQTINEKTQEQQTKRSAWGTVAGVFSGAATLAALIF